MTMPRIERMVILGLGLIGGSLALAARKAGVVGEVVGWGRRESSLQAGVELGVIDRFSLDLAEAVAGADLVVVATPTLLAEQVLLDALALVPPETLVTDVASVKGNLARAVHQHYGESVPPNLVLGHPIAGSEKSGVSAARDDLFINHRVILTPLPQTDAFAITRLQALWEACGAEVISMPVEPHDTILAATSHLPHLLAYALVDALAAQEDRYDIFRFAAGGFRDFTRIAGSDPVMWRDISLANRDALLQSLDWFEQHLSDVRQAVEQGDADSLMTIYRRAQSARERFGEMLARQQQSTITSE